MNPWPIKIKRHGWGPEFEAELKQLNSLMFELPDDETWLRWQKASSYASNFAHEKAKVASLAQFGTTSFAPSPGKCLRYCLPILFRLIPNPPPFLLAPRRKEKSLPELPPQGNDNHCGDLSPKTPPSQKKTCLRPHCPFASSPQRTSFCFLLPFDCSLASKGVASLHLQSGQEAEQEHKGGRRLYSDPSSKSRSPLLQPVQKKGGELL